MPTLHADTISPEFRYVADTRRELLARPPWPVWIVLATNALFTGPVTRQPYHHRDKARCEAWLACHEHGPTTTYAIVPGTARYGMAWGEAVERATPD